MGILKTRHLWASSMQYLNDTAEFKHAASLLNDLLRRHLATEHGPYNDLYGALLEAIPFFSEPHVCVGSFSEARDKLSQWRGYCPNGLGFSIGIDHHLLETQAAKQGFRLLRCVYDIEKQRAICEEMIASACETANRESDREQRRTVVLEHFLSPFLNLAPALKNTSFSEEQEWRLIGGPFKVGHPQIRFRPASWAVVPYFEFELTEKEPLEVEEIVVGPNPYPELARRSVEYLVASLPVNCKRVTEYAGTIRISG